jgi:hypothetical protein
VFSLVPAAALAAYVDQHLGCFQGEGGPVVVRLIQDDIERPGRGAQGDARGLSVAQDERATKHLLGCPLSGSIEFGRLGRAGGCHGAHLLKGRDLEPHEIDQESLREFGRDRHRRFRQGGEDPVAQPCEASGEDLRVGPEIGSKRDAKRNFP